MSKKSAAHSRLIGRGLSRPDRYSFVVAVLLVVAVGVLVVRGSHAFTSVFATETETGTLIGDAATSSDSSASGGQAITFGGGNTPMNLQVFTGGNNIALEWDMPANPVQSVQVFRDGQQIATVSPNSTAPFQNGQLGKEYDDNSVTAGSTYQYKVRAALTSGAVSAFSPAVSVTQPTQTQPVPNITVNTSAVPSLATYMSTNVVALLKTWYPKVADKIAYPTYEAPNSYTITLNTSVSGCVTANTQITCDPSFIQSCAAAGQSCAAVFVHESTHVIQAGGSGGTPWSVEGGASWASDFFARQNINTYVPYVDEQISTYTPGAWFLEYMRETYSQNFPRDINIAMHNGTSLDSTVSQDTGGKLTSVNQAWQDGVNAYNTSIGGISGIAGKCAEVQNGTVANGAKLVLDGCNNESDSAKINVVFNSGISGKCLDDWLGGSNTNADLYSCNASTSQMWMPKSDGTIRGYNGGCLMNAGGVNTNGNSVKLTACNSGDPAQEWSISGNTIVNPATAKCIDDPGSATADSTALDL